jgi:deazaflavin-dependent oxidoreductase (nitroreductase family)
MTEMTGFNAKIVEEFRANDGVVGGPFAGAQLVLLTTTGARTGAIRVNPLASLITDDGRLFVFASKGGAPENPDWFHNLQSHSEVGVELGREKFTALATPLTGPERDRIFALQKEKMPAFAGYEKATSRVIPVVELRRQDRPS